MNILLVDDEEDIHWSVGEFLTDFGHEVTSAKDGREALRILDGNSNIELVFSDIRMPGLDGIKLLQNIQLQFPSIPVILMTGHGDENIAMEALQNGAYDYLKKPVKLKELLSYIKRIEDRKKMEEQILGESEGIRVQPDQNEYRDQIVAMKSSMENYITCVEKYKHLVDELAGADEEQVMAKRDLLVHVLDEMPSLLASMRDAALQLDELADSLVDKHSAA